MHNGVPDSQNLPTQIKLLRAQRRAYGIAKGFMLVQFILTVALPVIVTVSAFFWSDHKSVAAVVSLFVLILDIAVLERAQRAARRLAAKIQEEFDCVVLMLPWDSFTVGGHPEPEVVHEYAGEYKDDPRKPLEDWYPRVVGEVPVHLARIICQRTNVWYDAQLRRRFGAAALGISILICLIIGVLGAIYKPSFDAWVIGAVVPLAPVILWGIREYLRHGDAAASSEHIKGQAQALWDRALAGKLTVEQCASESRLLQYAIYERRCNAPPIYDFMYVVLRGKLEERMCVGAEDMVAQVRRAIP